MQHSLSRGGRRAVVAAAVAVCSLAAGWSAGAVGTHAAGTAPADHHHHAAQVQSGSVPSTGSRVAALADVPSPGSWRLGVKVERVVHTFDLPGTDNEILLCAGSGNSVAWAKERKFVCYRYDRDAGTYSTFRTPTDWFCNAAVHMHDGKLLVASGTAIDGYAQQNGGKWLGAAESYTYTPTTGAVSRLGNVVPAWYPGLFEDQDGGIYKHGGVHNGVGVNAWEYLPRGQTSWQRVTWGWTTRTYSDIRLIGPKLAAYTGASSGPSANRLPAMLDLTTGRRTTTPGLRLPASRQSAASVMLYPAQQKKVLVLGGVKPGSNAIPYVDMIDYSVWPQRVPSFVPRAPLPQGTTLLLTTLLPNGQLFVTGGTNRWKQGHVRWAAIYDPAGDRWIRVASPSVSRGYHSSIMTDLDGRVSTFGGNPGAVAFEDDEEIYSPWYLDRPRPALGSVPGDMAYGASYPVGVTVPAGSTVGYFTLDRARADTHVYVPNQTMVDLPFTRDSAGKITVRVPSDRALLPPGYYKLAVNTTEGVPSRQVWVRIG